MTPSLDWPGLAYFVAVCFICVGWVLIPALKDFLKEYRRENPRN